MEGRWKSKLLILQLHVSIGFLLIVCKVAFRCGNESMTVDAGEEKQQQVTVGPTCPKVGLDHGPASFCPHLEWEAHSLSQPLLSSVLPSPNQPPD